MPGARALVPPWRRYLLGSDPVRRAIYVVGMIAAVRLLAARSLGWWMACVAVVLCVGMLALAVRSLLPALVLAVAAVVVTLVQRHRGRASVE